MAANAAWAALDPKQVDLAIEKAKKYLYDHQKDDKWEPSAGQDKNGDQATGQTALVIRALLSSGESPQDERIAKGIAFLKSTPTTGVFSLGVRCQLWQMLSASTDVRQVMTRDARALLGGEQKEGKVKGFYPFVIGGKDYNCRSSYYAALGLWYAAQSGFEVPNSYWQKTERAWVDQQHPNGGFSFRGKSYKSDPITAAMTSNAIATLFITQDFLHADEAITPRGNIRNPRIDQAMTWLTANFSQIAKDARYQYDYPYSTLYAVEEVGTASGFKYFSDIDWFDLGAQKLLRLQKPDGSWIGDAAGGEIPGTAFSLLFLSQGRAPVVINKLEYAVAGQIGNWNQRPRDVANVVRWIEKQTERDLRWQSVSLRASIDDLQEAPILYICGNQTLSFTAEEKKKLQTFSERGGIVVGNADAGADDFIKSFKSLASELFPNYELRELPPDHTIFTNEQFPADRWKKKPAVLGVSNGARELMLFLPDADLARAWQMQETSSKLELFQLTADIFQYSVDKKETQAKSQLRLETADESIKPVKSITVARLKYPGGWDPEPGGWQRLAAILHNRDRIELKTTIVELGKDSLGGDVTLAHLTGTGKLKLNDAARAALKKFVDDGGTLLVDSAGGNTVFAQSAELELDSIFGTDATRQLKIPLPVSSPVFSGGGMAIEQFGYRAYARKQAGGADLKGPRIRNFTIAGRAAVIFSREDLSVGLVGQPVDGINGYDPATATAIVRSVLLNAMKKS